jgi:large subunit ribosomal protein L5
MSYSPRLKEKYNAEIIPALTDKFGYKTIMRVPKLEKIVLSQGMGDAVADKKLITLRGEKMYDFLDRLISVALPRTRDFRGINPKGFDGRGNFNLGIKEHIIFPEIDIDKVNRILGMDITFVTSADSDEEGMALLDAFGFPFIKK